MTTETIESAEDLSFTQYPLLGNAENPLATACLKIMEASAKRLEAIKCEYLDWQGALNMSAMASLYINALSYNPTIQSVAMDRKSFYQSVKVSGDSGVQEEIRLATFSFDRNKLKNEFTQYCLGINDPLKDEERVALHMFEENESYNREVYNAFMMNDGSGTHHGDACAAFIRASASSSKTLNAMSDCGIIAGIHHLVNQWSVQHGMEAPFKRSRNGARRTMPRLDNVTQRLGTMTSILSGRVLHPQIRRCILGFMDPTATKEQISTLSTLLTSRGTAVRMLVNRDITASLSMVAALVQNRMLTKSTQLQGANVMLIWNALKDIWVEVPTKKLMSELLVVSRVIMEHSEIAAMVNRNFKAGCLVDLLGHGKMDVGEIKKDKTGFPMWEHYIGPMMCTSVKQDTKKACATFGTLAAGVRDNYTEYNLVTPTVRKVYKISECINYLMSAPKPQDIGQISGKCFNSDMTEVGLPQGPFSGFLWDYSASTKATIRAMKDAKKTQITSKKRPATEAYAASETFPLGSSRNAEILAAIAERKKRRLNN